MSRRRGSPLVAIAALLTCTPAPVLTPGCDPDNGGLTLPAGFCATVFADGVGLVRHAAVAPNGDLWVNLEHRRRSSTGTSHVGGEASRGGLVVLRDTSGDGRSDVARRTPPPPTGGTGILLHGPWVYFSTMTEVLRYRIAPPPGGLGVTGPPDTIVTGLPPEGHISRSLAMDGQGWLYVHVGSDSNVCRANAVEKRGADPCPELPLRAGIWRYSADTLRQPHRSGARFATGIRNAVGLAWNSGVGALYATSHGRDALHALWPALYTAAASAEKPSEELMRVDEGDDFGWPYCFHDAELNRKVLAPEYGGDGRATGRCARAKAPLLGFPGHWAPDGLVFYDGALFPARYRGGAFIAFHGSWNRGPRPEDGYRVVFVPFQAGAPAGPFEVFADGFAGGRRDPSRARHRPVGLAVAPDGALFITDDQGGRIWRVIPRPPGPGA